MPVFERCFVLGVLLFIFTVPCLGMTQETKVPFKIGFEFQLGGPIFEQGASNVRLEKTPLFSLFKNGEKLWHVEIDDQEIEFVTPPFSSDKEEELERLQYSISLMLQASLAFADLFQDKKEIGFGQWVEYLISHLAIDGLEIITTQAYVSLNFHDRPLLKPPREDWDPSFAPQVTFQYGLEYVIPLALVLLDGTCFKGNAISALPFLRNLYDIENDLSSVFTKENGMLFLHFFTCRRLTSSVDFNSENFELDLALKTLNAFKNGRMVSAKKFLPILSRRPFSLMWQEVKQEESFYHLYQKKIFQYLPLETQDIKTKFNFISYANRYYDLESGQVLDLSNRYEKLFSEEIRNQKVGKQYQKLLKEGIMSTEMIRNCNLVFEENVFNGLFDQVIRSMDEPVVHHFFNIKNEEEIRVEKLNLGVDLLSPLPFAGHNSMGAYTPNRNPNFDPTYGEAILEFRGIKDISSFVLNKFGLDGDDLYKNFLAGKDKKFLEIPRQVEALVTFLKNLDLFHVGHKILLKHDDKGNIKG